MYKITFCRTGKYPCMNFGNKGLFVRTFNSLSDLAKFISSMDNALYTPYIRKELTKRERRILFNKIYAVSNKLLNFNYL